MFRHVEHLPHGVSAPVDKLESSAKTYFTLQDEVLFEKHTDFISVLVFPFKFLSLLATTIRRYGQLRRDTLHTVAERLLHLLQRCNEELHLRTSPSSTRSSPTPSASFSSTRGASPTLL